MNLFKKVHSIIILSVALIFLLVNIVQAVSAADPGTDGNPLVSQDYVDAKINDITNTVNALKQQVQTLGQPQGTSKYVAVQILQGKQVTLGDGAEIILRSGKATAVASTAGGIADVTDGMDIQTGGNVPLNHLCLIPRDDGRGIKAITDLWIMVKGTYTMK